MKKNRRPEIKAGEVLFKWCLHWKESHDGNTCIHIPYKSIRLGAVVSEVMRPVYVDTKEILQCREFVAISMDGQVVSRRRLRSNVERNLEESRQARTARMAAAPRF